MSLQLIRTIAMSFALVIPLGACAVVQEKTLGEAFDDASASSQIKAKLLAASAKSFNEIDVEVTSRMALLTGRVATKEERIEAERIAWSVRTIDEIANELEVIPDSSVLQNVNDEWITARVRARITTDKAIKGVNYNVETFNGTVYLLGLALDEEELQAAATHASLVKGVAKVVSYVKMRHRMPPNFAPDGVAEAYAPPQQESVREEKSSGYGDPYADPYGDNANANPYADQDYQDLAGGF